jgi:peptide/nickel transport system substrate-binding protein
MKKLIAMLLALVMIMGLAACGAKAPEAPAEENKPVIENSDNLTKETAPVEPEVKFKDRIVIATNVAVGHMDIHRASTGELIMFNMTHNTLVGYDPATMSATPELATEWEWVTDTQIKFKLREDVVFHNGEKMTSDDVIFSLNKGIEAGAARLAGIESIEADGDYGVIINLSSPNVDFLTSISYCNAGIGNREAVEADEVEGWKIGTGPWAVSEFLANDRTEMVRNDNYFGTLPKGTQVSLTYIPEVSARLIALETGEVDVVIGLSGTDVEYVQSNPDLEMIFQKTGTLLFFAFDISEGKGANKDLRLAMAHALNTEEVVQVCTNGYADAAHAQWGRYTAGYFEDLEKYEYNLDLAKEYLAKSGIDTLDVIARPDYQDEAIAIQAQMKAIGLTINVIPVESAAANATSQWDVHEQEAMVHGYGYGPFGDDCRGNYYPGVNSNKAHLDNERIVELIEAAKGEFDAEKRNAMYHEMQQMCHDEAWYLPLYYRPDMNATRVGVGGINWQNPGSICFADIWAIAE